MQKDASDFVWRWVRPFLVWRPMRVKRKKSVLIVMLEADNIVKSMQCCNEEMKGLRRRNRNDRRADSLQINFRRNDHFFETSVEEVGRRGKRGDVKVSVLI